MAAAELVGLPPGYRFVPTDGELVQYYLVPRILGQSLQPGPSDIIQEDPLSGAPWDLLAKHRRKEEAFFFSEVQPVQAKGNRKKRTCVGGGTWEGQGKRKRRDDDDDEEGKKPLRVHGCGEKVEWDKYVLNFHEPGVKGSTGWVMHEYSVTAPPELARSTVRLYRIRFSGHGQNAKKRKRDAQDDRGSDGEDDEAAAAPATARLCGVEADHALFVGEYPSARQANEDVASFPVAAVPDVVAGNAADEGVGAGAGNDQNFAVFVDFEGNLQFIDSLPDFDLYSPMLPKDA